MTNTRSFTPEEIADIIVETVTETEKDLTNMSVWLHKAARISLYIAAALRDKDIAIALPATRALKDGIIAKKAMSRLLAKAPTKKIE